MRNLIIIAFALFALGAVTCLAEAPAGKATSRPRWEYQTLTREKLAEMGKGDLTAGLNKAGDDGWELVAVSQTQGMNRGNPANTTVSYYFKRVKGEATPTPTKTSAAAPEAGKLDLQLIRLRFARASDLADTLQAVYRGSALQIVPDLRTNTLILRGTTKQLEEVHLLVQNLDVEGEHKKATPD